MVKRAGTKTRVKMNELKGLPITVLAIGEHIAAFVRQVNLRDCLPRTMFLEKSSPLCPFGQSGLCIFQGIDF